MTIQRIQFEDCGQDFTWWDIDTETGAITDCGPFQASVWTKCTVAVNSIDIGSAPFIFTEDEPDGTYLKYPVVSLGMPEAFMTQLDDDDELPAWNGGDTVMLTEDTRKELARLLELVETRLAALPRATWESRADHRKAVQELQYDLEQEGARFGEISGNHVVSLARVRAGSTMSADSALRNWCAGARKRLGIDDGRGAK